MTLRYTSYYSITSPKTEILKLVIHKVKPLKEMKIKIRQNPLHYQLLLISS